RTDGALEVEIRVEPAVEELGVPGVARQVVLRLAEGDDLDAGDLGCRIDDDEERLRKGADPVGVEPGGAPRLAAAGRDLEVDEGARDLPARELAGAALLLGGQERRPALELAAGKGEAKGLVDGDEDLRLGRMDGEGEEEEGSSDRSDRFELSSPRAHDPSSRTRSRCRR